MNRFERAVNGRANFEVPAIADPGLSLEEMKQFVRNHFEDVVNRKKSEVASRILVPTSWIATSRPVWKERPIEEEMEVQSAIQQVMTSRFRRAAQLVISVSRTSSFWLLSTKSRTLRP